MTLELKTTAELLRLSHISRWGIVQTAVRQSVAEHSWRVWCLVRQWADVVGLTAEEKAWAQELALLHDVPEIRTGDCPTPAKSPEMKALLTQVENEIYSPLAELEEQANSRAKDLMKYCDICESVIFLHVNGVGKHAKDVEALLKRQAEGYILSSDSFTTGHKAALIRELEEVLAES